MSRTIFPLTIMALALASCGHINTDNTTSRVTNVFGRDDRVAMTGNEYPWSAVVRLSNGCTGALVGRNLVLTAAHCVTDDNGAVDSWMKFEPNYRDGRSADQAKMVVARTRRGSSVPQTDIPTPEDWAVVVIDKNLGDTFGAFAVSDGRVDYTKLSVTLAGYSGDFMSTETAGVHEGCSIHAVNNGELEHDCDMTRGASGGPMFINEDGQYKIIGVNVGEYRDGEFSLAVPKYSSATTNVGAPAEGFSDAVRSLGGKAIVVTAAPQPKEIPVVPGSGPMPRGQYWFAVHAVTEGNVVAQRAMLDACARTIQKTIPGVTCWRTSSDFFETHCHDPSGREDAIQGISCVKKVFGPFIKPSTGTSKPFLRIK